MTTVLATSAIAIAIAIMTLGPRLVNSDALGGDKIQHILGFGAIAVPASLLRPKWLFWIAPLTIVAGGIIELFQTQLAREGSFEDWLADCIGVALAVVLGCSLRYAYDHKTTKRKDTHSAGIWARKTPIIRK